MALDEFTFGELRARFVVDGAAITHSDLGGDFLLARVSWTDVEAKLGPGVPYTLTQDDLERSDWRVIA